MFSPFKRMVGGGYSTSTLNSGILTSSPPLTQEGRGLPEVLRFTPLSLSMLLGCGVRWNLYPAINGGVCSFLINVILSNVFAYNVVRRGSQRWLGWGDRRYKSDGRLGILWINKRG